MEYVVLARKLRPNRFSDLIGQDTVARILRNAVRTDRVAHAFLFTGSRGVGKTSTARILTKALNCLAPEDGEPCNACSNCVEITANASPDVYEIDAASNRGIDNIRELRDNTKYAPAKSRYKTYIIDEVHMLTTESFNALLKTLEEPPAHIKFILATTSPHRIPETIISRCQRFDFPRIPVPLMVDYLARVTAAEGIALSPVALGAIARNAAGGMRDALTAVDQVVSYAGPEADDEQVLGILGLMDTREALALLQAILARDLPAAVAAFNETLARGHDLPVVLETLLAELKQLALYRALSEHDAHFQDVSPAAMEFYAAQAEPSLDVIQQLFYVFLELEAQLKQSEHDRLCFEMALVKACRVEPLVGVPDLLAQVRDHLRSEGGAPQARPAQAPPQAPTQSRSREGETPWRPGGSARAREATEGEDPEPASAVPVEAPPRPAAMPPARTPAVPPWEARRSRPPAAATPPQQPEPPPFERPPAVPPWEEEPHPGPVGEDSPPPDAPPEPPRAAPQPTPPAQPPAEAAPREGYTPPSAPELPAEAPCDDPRWRAFVAAVQGSRFKKLGADLRRTEVVTIASDNLELVAPEAGLSLGATERAFVDERLAQAFGGPFRLVLIDDTNRKARPAYTLVGREHMERAAARAAAEAEAVDDEGVRRLLQFFPQGRIARVAPTEPEPDRS